MLEYITYKKVKKHKAEKAAREEAERMGGSSSHDGKHGRIKDTAEPGTPVLDPADESFLENLLNDEGPRPPLPPRMKTPDVDWVSDMEASSTLEPSREEAEDVKGKKKQVLEKEREKEEKPGRLSRLFSRKHKDTELVKAGDLPSDEKEREVGDVQRILNRLNLSTKNNKVVPLTADSSDLLNRFTQIFKDLANGVPTAYGDLVGLFEDREGTLSKGFNKLPKSLQKLVMQLPEKVTGNFAPEIMLAAAHAQGIKAEKGNGLKDQAGKIFMPKNIMELVTKPGAIIGMLKAIVNALRVRWPAFIGMNVIWSVALFLLMFVLWYCYKRGREQRLQQEKGEPIDGSDRIEELPDDLMIEGPPRRKETERSRSRDGDANSYDYNSRDDHRSRRYEDDRERRRDRHRHGDGDRHREWDSASYSSVEDNRARRHERYRRHEDMTRREEEMQRREEDIARREAEMSRRSSHRRD